MKKFKHYVVKLGVWKIILLFPGPIKYKRIL